MDIQVPDSGFFTDSCQSIKIELFTHTITMNMSTTLKISARYCNSDYRASECHGNIKPDL
ncbi:hypothetical protein SARI_02993 [Salmonella enterica subsp. arizonae serovar 62:z4,z23:-]|uniref:Uncharacterized protein n=1 Tax=Salmonella arizonae (strain ATCC BAA-731 / CDC346-86 / RSK2980) TaxID=41514 RepID=A9MR90_SALAR|nr:hypothetical protein SARI_02993 [Salmonella enterica subsp. arizonae serovar 62:z4,z23:-]